MGLITGQATQWNSLTCTQGTVDTLPIRCVICGNFHATDDHWRLMAEMPQHPAELIDDLVKMRLYQPAALETADAISQAELRTALFIAMVSNGSPKRERLVRDLITLAGGLDQAFSAAFGPKAGEFFTDAQRTSQVTRRKFLQNIAVGAALMTLANCASRPDDASGNGNCTASARTEPAANIEKSDLKGGLFAHHLCHPDYYVQALGLL